MTVGGKSGSIKTPQKLEGFSQSQLKVSEFKLNDKTSLWDVVRRETKSRNEQKDLVDSKRKNSERVQVK